MPKLMLLAMEHIRTTTKKRRGVCPHRVEELRYALETGEDIPPIRVNRMQDGTYAVKDGRHRLAAHKAAFMTQIWAIVENITCIVLRKLSALARSLLQGHLRWSFYFKQETAEHITNFVDGTFATSSKCSRERYLGCDCTFCVHLLP